MNITVKEQAAGFRGVPAFFLGNHLVDHQQLVPILRTSDVEKDQERRNHVRVKGGSENLEKGNFTLLLQSSTKEVLSRSNVAEVVRALRTFAFYRDIAKETSYE